MKVTCGKCRFTFDGIERSLRCPHPRLCDHKFVDSKVCLKCGWTPPDRSTTAAQEDDPERAA